MTLSAEDTLVRFNELGCEYGKLIEQRLGAAEKCIDKHDKNIGEFMNMVQKIYIAVIILSFLSGVNVATEIVKLIGGR